MFTNGLSALRALAALGRAGDRRRPPPQRARPARARGVVPVLAPDPLVDEAGYLEVLAEVAAACRASAASPSRRRTPAWCWRPARRARLPGMVLPGSGWDVIGPLLAKRAQIDAARRAGVPVPPTWFAGRPRRRRAGRGRGALPGDRQALRRHRLQGARGPAGDRGARRPEELLAAWERAHDAGDELLLQEVVPGGDDALWTVGSYTARWRPRACRARSAAASWPRCRRASAPAALARRAGRTRP